MHKKLKPPEEKIGNSRAENNCGVHMTKCSCKESGYCLHLAIKLVVESLVEFDIHAHEPLVTQSME